MKKTNILTIIFVILLCITPIIQSSIPELPSTVYGTLHINGAPAQPGTIIEAYAGGIRHVGGSGNPHTVEKKGEYSLAISGVERNTNVRFFILRDGVRFYAEQNHSKGPAGSFTNLNLTIVIPVVTVPQIPQAPEPRVTPPRIDSPVTPPSPPVRPPVRPPVAPPVTPPVTPPLAPPPVPVKDLIISTEVSQNIVEIEEIHETEIIAPEIPVSFEIKETSISAITISTLKDVTGVVIRVQQLVKRPAGIPEIDNLYQYLSIVSNIKSEYIDNVRIRFNVSNSWIEEYNIDVHTIHFNRFNVTTTQWDALPTEIVEKHDDYVVFESISPHLSIFAVTGEKIIEPPIVKEPVVDLLLIGILLAIIIAIIVAIVLLKKKRNKKETF